MLVIRLDRLARSTRDLLICWRSSPRRGPPFAPWVMPGADTTNQWRKEQPPLILNLIGADLGLGEANLSGAKLCGANFYMVNLSGQSCYCMRCPPHTYALAGIFKVRGQPAGRVRKAGGP